jgi:hypothetical protein
MNKLLKISFAMFLSLFLASSALSQTSSDEKGPCTLGSLINNAVSSTGKVWFSALAPSKGMLTITLYKNGVQLAQASKPLKDYPLNAPVEMANFTTAGSEADNGSTPTHINYNITQTGIDAGAYTVEATTAGNFNGAWTGSNVTNHYAAPSGNGNCSVTTVIVSGV